MNTTYKKLILESAAQLEQKLPFDNLSDSVSTYISFIEQNQESIFWERVDKASWRGQVLRLIAYVPLLFGNTIESIPPERIPQRSEINQAVEIEIVNDDTYDEIEVDTTRIIVESISKKYFELIKKVSRVLAEKLSNEIDFENCNDTLAHYYEQKQLDENSELTVEDFKQQFSLSDRQIKIIELILKVAALVPKYIELFRANKAKSNSRGESEESLNKRELNLSSIEPIERIIFQADFLSDNEKQKITVIVIEVLKEESD